MQINTPQLNSYKVTLVTIAGAIISALAAFGLPLSTTKEHALMTLVEVLGPFAIVSAAWVDQHILKSHRVIAVAVADQIASNAASTSKTLAIAQQIAANATPAQSAPQQAAPVDAPVTTPVSAPPAPAVEAPAQNDASASASAVVSADQQVKTPIQ